MIFWRMLNLLFAAAAASCALATMAGLIVFFPFALGGFVLTLIPAVRD
jgi:hypothetical protein